MNKNEIIQRTSNYLVTADELNILVLNGSMADSNVTHDKFQDIDFSVLSSNIMQTTNNIKYFNLFKNNILYTEDHQKKSYVHASIKILLESGKEIGFNIYDNLEIFLREINRFVVLLFNKLNESIDFSPPTHRPFYVSKPQKEEFNKLLIDIYWATADVMKGVKREQFIYAKHKYDTILQPKMKQLLTWYIRDLHDWNVSLGAHGKRIKDYVESDIYNQYLSTYSANSLESIPEALLTAKSFVTDIGNRLADSLGYQFPSDIDNKMFKYLEFKNRK